MDFDLDILDKTLSELQADESKHVVINSKNEVQELLELLAKDGEVISKMPQDVLTESEWGLFEDSTNEIEKYKHDLGTYWDNFAYDLTSFNRIKAVLHAFKGVVNTLGLKRFGKEVHLLETFIDGALNKTDEQKKLLSISFKKRVEHILYSLESVYLERVPNFSPLTFSEKDFNLQEPVKEIEKKEYSIMDETILVPLSQINQLVENASGLKMYSRNLNSEIFQLRQLLDDFTEITGHFYRSAKELEEYADNNIQSSNKSEQHSELDPLLLDRFTKINEIASSITEVYHDLDDLNKRLKGRQREFSNYFEEIGSITTYSLDRLLKLRLIDFHTLTTRFKTACRKVSQLLNKKVNLEIQDNGVQIDAVLTDQIKGVVELIVRNSIGHGIEEESVRKARNKPEQGLIIISATQSANAITILIKDDGGGVNVEKVRQKAIEKGLAGHNEPFDMEKAISFILRSGFSTADKLSDNAGRGVGLDSVNEEILKLGGALNIRSEEGKGMEVEIIIPTSYATTYGLLVQAESERFIILSDLVEEVTFVKTEEFTELEKKGEFEWKGEKIPFIKASQLFNLNSDGETSTSSFKKILIVDSNGLKIALQVEEVLENKEILIKQSERALKSIPGYIGVSLLLDGYPSYVLDPVQTYQYKRSVKQLNKEKEVKQQLFFVPNILVVDDSPVIRSHTKKFLDKYGFKNFAAKNGKDALEKMLKTVPDLILLDIEMPEMNGFEFTEHIKQDDLYKDIPIIMITSRINNVHQQKARELGVNEYLIKPFVQEELLALIRELGYRNNGKRLN